MNTWGDVGHVDREILGGTESMAELQKVRHIPDSDGCISRLVRHDSRVWCAVVR